MDHPTESLDRAKEIQPNPQPELDRLKSVVVPYSTLDDFVLIDPRLGSNEKVLYWVLRSFAHSVERASFPKYETIAARAGVCKRTAMRAVAELVKYGYLEKNPRTTVRGLWTSNLYRLIAPSHPDSVNHKACMEWVHGLCSKVTVSHSRSDCESPPEVPVSHPNIRNLENKEKEKEERGETPPCHSSNSEKRKSQEIPKYWQDLVERIRAIPAHQDLELNGKLNDVLNDAQMASELGNADFEEFVLEIAEQEPTPANLIAGLDLKYAHFKKYFEDWTERRKSELYWAEQEKARARERQENLALGKQMFEKRAAFLAKPIEEQERIRKTDPHGVNCHGKLRWECGLSGHCLELYVESLESSSTDLAGAHE